MLPSLQLEQHANSWVVSGRLLEIEPIRYTPSGLPVCEFKLFHESEQIEEKIPRRVKFELKATSMGVLATQIARCSLGTLLECQGFMLQRSYKSKLLSFHVSQFKFKSS